MSDAAAMILRTERTKEIYAKLRRYGDDNNVHSDGTTSSCPSTAQTWSPPSAIVLWEYFLMLTEIPRPSGKIEQVRDRIVEIVQTRPQFANVETFIDDAGNLILRKPPNCSESEHLPGICFQGHLDMVTTQIEARGGEDEDGDDQNRNACFDFDMEPIRVRFDDSGTYLVAEGTTLGADNGIGVAAALAMMHQADELFPNGHPMLECLFTVDEETTMSGAENLSSTILQSHILINCDSEDENAICMGCAGGYEYQISLTVDAIHTLKLFHSGNNNNDDDPIISLSIKLSGLVGGHSGTDIDKGHGNACKLVNRMLVTCFDQVAPRHESFAIVNYTGGNAPNAIPSSCTVNIVTRTSRKDAIIQCLNETFRLIQDEYQSLERTMVLEIQQQQQQEPIANGKFMAVSFKGTQQILDLITLIPHGVLRMSPEIDGLVESSTSIGVISWTDDITNGGSNPSSKSLSSSGSTASSTICVHSLTRSDRTSALQQHEMEIDCLCRATGARNSGRFNAYPGWKPNMQSKALLAAQKAHRKVFDGKQATVYSCHAGLETGFIVDKYPHMDCISIGPQIDCAHTVQERVSVPSVNHFYVFLKEVVANLSSSIVPNPNV